MMIAVLSCMVRKHSLKNSVLADSSRAWESKLYEYQVEESSWQRKLQRQRSWCENTLVWDTQVVQVLGQKEERGLVTKWVEVNRDQTKWPLNRTRRNIVCFCGIIMAKDTVVSVGHWEMRLTPLSKKWGSPERGRKCRIHENYKKSLVNSYPQFMLLCFVCLFFGKSSPF